MAYEGAWTTSAPGNLEQSTPGQVAYPNMPAEIKDFSVETAAGVGLGVLVSRGTDKGKQCVIGAANPLGFTCRLGDIAGPGGSTNDVVIPQNSQVAVMRSGYIWLQLKSGDTGDPDSVVNVTLATGVVGLGAAGGGEVTLEGIQLDEVVSGTRTCARFRLDNPRIMTSITSVTLNGGTAVTPTAGVVDLTVVESIQANTDAPLSGDVLLTDTGTVALTTTEVSNTIDIAVGG